MAKNIKLEGELLKFSIYAMSLFSIAGIVVGLLLSSNLIIFDALYSMLGVVLSFATLQASRFISIKDDFNFPFGKEALEPGIVIVQYVIILVVLLYTLGSSINTLKSGGNEVVLGWTIFYIALSTMFLVGVYRNLKIKSLKADSMLIDAEVLQWKLSFIQSMGALIAYIFAQVIVWLSYPEIVPYVDPAILIIVVLVLLKTPIMEIKKATKELLGMRSVSADFQKNMQAKLDEICELYDISKSYLRIRKTGSIVFIEIDFLVNSDFKYSKIEQQDMIREKVNQALNLVDYDVWLTIAFTSHRKWAE